MGYKDAGGDSTYFITRKFDNKDTLDEINLLIGANRIDPEIPLHVTRFFPAAEMSTTPPTPVRTVYRMAELARRSLKYVFTGNV